MRDLLKGALKFLGGLAAVCGVVVAILYFFFVRVVVVGHNAMAPTIMLGDRVVVWRGTDFEIGDVILCPHPELTGRFVMGRVVGRPGHTVEVRQGRVAINGQVPDADMHPPITWIDTETGRQVEMIWGDVDLLDHHHRIFYQRHRPSSDRAREVGPGLFILSDNRSYRGEDSRDFGVVRQPECVGRVFFRLTAGQSPPEIPHGPLDLID